MPNEIYRMSTESPVTPRPEFAIPQPLRRIGLLRRRLLAALIDCVILGIIGHFVAWPFFDTLVALGPGAKLVGFFIALLYFAVPESSIGHGASLGKRFLLLQVVHADGSTLTVEESLIRYTIFAAPFFLCGLALPLPRFPLPLFYLLLALISSVGGLTQYLIVFNRSTRQGLHDLSVKCFVAEADRTGPVAAKPIWKPHWRIAAALLVVLVIGGGVLSLELLNWPPYLYLMDDARMVEQVDGVQSASPHVILQRDAKTGASSTYLAVVIRCACQQDTEETVANEAAKALIEGDLNFPSYARVIIYVVRGYDIGIASSLPSQTYSDTPTRWSQRLFGDVPPTESSVGSGNRGNTEEVYQIGNGVSAPVPLNTVEAEFTDEARRTKNQGICLIELIVDAQGNPQNPRVIRRLGMGLDEKALDAVKKYRFKPAMKDGKIPVPVKITVEVNFRLY
jgi:TonB family protein